MKRGGIWLGALAILFSGMAVQTQAAESGELLIPISVVAEGSEADPEALYTVDLVPETDGCPMPEGSAEGICRLRMTGGSMVLRFSCTKPGVFDYTVHQIPGMDPDCTYDSSSFRLRLLVSRTETAELTANAEIYSQDGDFAPGILFRNRWTEPAWVSFCARITLDGETPGDDDFAFLLLSQEGTLVFREKNQGQYVSFPALRFDREGTYRYELKETARPEDGICYDRAVYTAFIQVTKEEDYQAQVTWQRNGRPYEGTPAFLNTTGELSPQTGDPIGIAAAVFLLSGTALMGMAAGWRKKHF